MIYNYASSVVTMDDVKRYFQGESWPISQVNKNKFIGESVWNFRIELEQLDPIYNVVIKSQEDEDDSQEISTDDPISAISKFLSQGLSESELIRAASDSTVLSNLLKRLASSIEDSKNPSLHKVSRVLRRISVIDTPIYRVSKDQNNAPLLRRMKDEGWKVQEGDNNILNVDIGEGLYNAEIYPEKMNWDYKMEFKGTDKLTITGKTTDPIRKYQDWKKDPELGKAWKDLKAKREEEKINNMGPQTVPARPRKKQ